MLYLWGSLWCCVASAADLPTLEVAGPDIPALLAGDEERERLGLPPQFAVARQVSIDPDTAGRWEQTSSGPVWRLRIVAEGARSLNLGFDRYRMPEGGELRLSATDGSTALSRSFGAADNEDHGQLWTPLLETDDLTLELSLLPGTEPLLDLHLASVNVGYRRFGASADKSGPCNIDVICPEGDDWRREIASVAVYGTNGTTFCTGFLVNNTAEDGRPLLQTADHCGIRASNAASVVVYWNFESPVCGQQGGGRLDQWQTGATFLAGYAPSDVTLIELDDEPLPEFQVSWAGWSRRDATSTSGAGVHHPNTDEKAISLTESPTAVSSYFGYGSPGDGTHLRVIAWDQGTTEGGSSGSPLFDQDHHVIGQLHGGYASCQATDASDWYGRFALSWLGGGTPSSGLSSWLDPLGTGAETLDTRAPWETLVRLDSPSSVTLSGPAGGPFRPAAASFDLVVGGEPRSVEVSTDADWLDVDPESLVIAPGGGATVSLQPNARALALFNGQYRAAVTFDSDDGASLEAEVVLVVGQPEVQYRWPLDTDPGWTMEAGWAFGQPSGGGGGDPYGYGSPDPTAGYTGDNVLGYNLSGDYPPNLPQRHLVSEPIDCSELTGVSLHLWRWLCLEDGYDHAGISVSVDGGASFEAVWSSESPTYGGAWEPLDVDLSAIADGQPDVRLRWTMGPTDYSVQFCGWNIDDIEIIAFPRCDLDGDGEAAPDCGGQDCDDESAAISGAQIEDCADGLDNDCDGDVDLDDPDCATSGTTATDGAPAAEPEEKGGRCGCAGAPASGGAWLLPALLVGLGRRRSRAARNLRSGRDDPARRPSC